MDADASCFEIYKISIARTRRYCASPKLQHSASRKAAPAMSKAKGAAVDTIVKLIVGAGQASPSPPVGPALGSKGVKSMDFCKVCRSVFRCSI